MTNSTYSNYIIPAKQSTQDFSEQVGFKRLGIYKVNLAPGTRSSLPHAESLEEEFVFVISGNPHVWIDGYVYELKPNCAVGFPAGTGIAHNFINNSLNNVELLVIGERTKKENRCAFPVNPEQKELSKIWWVDAPQRPLGPHSGKVGNVHGSEIGTHWPDFIVDCAQLKTTQGWHYPGDSETFRQSVRLTNHLGLQVLGINFETIAPGKRSAFPHSHRAEEEFAFILSGKAHIWLNGFVHEAKAGDAVAFLPYTNIAHVLINDTEEPVRYIMVGEATDPANEDRVFYPTHHFRNEQCRKQNFFWQDRPEVEMGSHSGRPQWGLNEHLALDYAKPIDEKQILDLFEKSLKYFQAVEGCGPSLTLC